MEGGRSKVLCVGNIAHACVVSISELLEHQNLFYTKTIIVYIGMLTMLACLDVKTSEYDKSLPFPIFFLICSLGKHYKYSAYVCPLLHPNKVKCS